MGKVLEAIDYKNVFKYFEEICNIPRGSKHNEKISNYLVKFAKDNNLEYVQDEHYNVIIYKDATKGYEDIDTVILQAHMDMVCEKDENIEHDFLNEGLEIVVDDGYIRANGTTLGADDGIGVAYCLALLSANDVNHPNIKAVITTDEEIGMLGADALDTKYLEGGYVLNLDQEEEEIMLSSCAGGIDVDGEIILECEKKDGVEVEFYITGLKGGHSGVEINNFCMNADIVFARVLNDIIKKRDVRIVSVFGGKKDNVIPNEVTSKLVVCKEDVKDFYNDICECYNVLKDEYFAYEKDMAFFIGIDNNARNNIDDRECLNEMFKNNNFVNTSIDALTKKDTKKLCEFLLTVPNGVQKMSASINGLVESSLNLGGFTVENGKVKTKHLIRSSIESYKEFICDRLEIVYKTFGGKIVKGLGYPAWEYRQHSILRPLSSKIYKEMFNKELSIEALHAGLECGVLYNKNKDLDIVSFGPNILDIHTSREKLDIESTKRMYDFMLKILENLKSI